MESDSHGLSLRRSSEPEGMRGEDDITRPLVDRHWHYHFPFTITFHSLSLSINPLHRLVRAYTFPSISEGGTREAGTLASSHMVYSDLFQAYI